MKRKAEKFVVFTRLSLNSWPFCSGDESIIFLTCATKGCKDACFDVFRIRREGNGICFPQNHSFGSPGAAVEQAIKSLGHHSIEGVRVGKTVTFEMEGSDTPEIRDEIDRLCDGLLSNPVIEDYRFEISSE